MDLRRLSRDRTPRALLLAAALALAGGGLLGHLHVALAHGGACAADAGQAGPCAPCGQDGGDDASGRDCALCRLVHGTPPALTAVWSPPRPLSAVHRDAAEAASPGRPRLPACSVRAPPAEGSAHA